MEKASTVIDWYWNKGGIDRQGDYQLTPRKWLDQLYRVNGSYERISTALNSTKASLALWGTSQTGKSTLLSTYIDAGSNDRGVGSAIDWGHPARFGKPDTKDSTITTFNPHNEGLDGSGCVTRFTLADPDSIKDKANPVEVKLFTRKELMHALAAGYLSECNTTLSGGEQVFWSRNRVNEEIAQYISSGTKPSRAAFELLHDLVEVLQLLSQMDHARFRNLSGDNFTVIRKTILDSVALNSSEDNAARFAASMLWDSVDALTKTFNELVGYVAELQARLPKVQRVTDIRIACSIRVAALLVDMASYSHFVKPIPKTVEFVQSLRCVRLEDDLLLITDEPRAGSELLFPTGKHRQFALLQAVVWELKLPLRSDVLSKNSPLLYDLLQRSDVVDFPGTSQQQRGAEEALLNAENMATDEGDIAIFTRLLKRGRTASIVQSSVLNCDIDGFTMLCRWQKHIAKPDQLAAGIDLWWRALTGKSVSTAVNHELPLNLVVTFMGKLVSDLLVREIPNLGGILEEYLEVLGDIKKPSVSYSFATAYPQFREDFIGIGTENITPSPEQLDGVVATMRQSPDFQRRFIHGGVLAGEAENQTLREMISAQRSNGKDYLIQKLKSDASGSRRKDKLRHRLADLNEDWESILQDAMPAEAGDVQRQKKECIDGCRDGLMESLDKHQEEFFDQDAARAIGYHWRLFMEVYPETLNPLEENLATKRVFRLSRYLETQLMRWKNDIPAAVDIDLMGLPDKVTALRLRGYLVEAVLLNDTQDFTSWFRGEFSNISSAREANGKRRFLASWLSDRLLGTDRSVPHPPMGDEMLQYLFQHSRAQANLREEFDYHHSFHWRNFLKPLLDRLEDICDLTTKGRGKQPGDDELVAIIR